MSESEYNQLIELRKLSKDPLRNLDTLSDTVKAAMRELQFYAANPNLNYLIGFQKQKLIAAVDLDASTLIAWIEKPDDELFPLRCALAAVPLTPARALIGQAMV